MRRFVDIRASVVSSFALVAASATFMAMPACSMMDDDAAPQAPAADPNAPARTDDPAANPSGNGTQGPSIDPTKAGIRVIHASPDAPPVDVYAKGSATPLLTGLKYGDATAYLEVPPGSYEIELRASPSSANDPAVYTTSALAVKAGEQYSAIACGLLSSKEDGSNFRVMAMKEDFGLAGSDTAIARVVHASPDAPTVGIDLGNDGPMSPEIGGVDRFATSAASGVLLSAGKPLQIGVDAGGMRVTAFTTPALPAGTQLLLIATGLVGKRPSDAQGFGILAVGPQGALGFIRQNPYIYALHAGSDAPAVDLFAGVTELVDDVSFGQLSGPIQVPPGSYTIDFFPTTAGHARPGGTPAASSTTPMIDAGQEVLAIATGLLGGSGADAFKLVAVDRSFTDQQDGQARLRVVHASPGAPAVDLGILNIEHVVNPVLFSNLTFGNASSDPGNSASPGQNALGLTPAGDNDTVLAAFHVKLTAQSRSFGIVAGVVGATGAQQSLRLFTVDTASAPWQVATVMPQPQQ